VQNKNKQAQHTNKTKTNKHNTQTKQKRTTVQKQKVRKNKRTKAWITRTSPVSVVRVAQYLVFVDYCLFVFLVLVRLAITWSGLLRLVVSAVFMHLRTLLFVLLHFCYFV
jgi:Flp pilus assembly protein TadB